MILPAYINVNASGIPTLKSNSVTVGTERVAFDFNNHPNVGAPYRGLLIIYLAQLIPTGTTNTLPIVFTSGGGNPQPLTKENGNPVLVSDIIGTGIYILWYESQTNTLAVPNSLS